MFETVSRHFSMETQLFSWSGTKEAQQYSPSEIEIVIMWILATGIINMGSLKESLESCQLTAFLWQHSHISQRNLHFVILCPLLACKPSLCCLPILLQLKVEIRCLNDFLSATHYEQLHQIAQHHFESTQTSIQLRLKETCNFIFLDFSVFWLSIF